MSKTAWLTAGLCALLLQAASPLAQTSAPGGVPSQSARAVPPSHQEIAPGVIVVKFDNANSLITVGDDGTLLVETQLPNRAQALGDYIRTITPKPVRIAIDSHWHSDHAGGNEYFRSLGAITIADEISYKRLGKRQFSKISNRVQEPLGPLGLPMVTFPDRMTVFFNGDDIEIVHRPEAHTDGDSTIYLKRANVIHMGDLFTTDSYTNVRNVDAFVKALDDIITSIDDKTKVIPWHGDVGSKKDLQDWRRTFAVAGGRIKKMIGEGKTADEIVSAKPFQDFNARWNGGGRADAVVRMIIAGELGDPNDGAP